MSRSARAAGLPLASFAMVMATGITAAELRLSGHAQLAAGTLALAAASFVFLAAATCWRAVRQPAALRADLMVPERAFAAFAVPAAACVLCAGLVAAGFARAGAALAAFALAAWLALTFMVPARLALLRRAAPAVPDVNGTWFLWAVATQGLAVAAAALAGAGLLPAAPASWAGRGLWLAGIALYVVTLALVAFRLLTSGPGPAGMRAPYWVATGAASISVLAAALVLRIPGQPVPRAARLAATCVTAALWALATLLIPVLAGTSVRLWLCSRPRPLRVSCPPGAWTIAFPVGMYATASMRFGTSFGLPEIHRIGALAAGPAAAVWAAAFVALVIVVAAVGVAVLRQRRRRAAGGAALAAPPGRQEPHGRQRYKCQALIRLLPAGEDGGGLPEEPVYRAVLYARHHGSGASEMFSGLVSAGDDGPAQADMSRLVTVEAFGREPDDCLAPGDLFTIWRGRDLARGIVTRRIFV